MIRNTWRMLKRMQQYTRELNRIHRSRSEYKRRCSKIKNP